MTDRLATNGRCRSCQAPMAWAGTDTGGRMPMDPDPHPDGNVEVLPVAASQHRRELQAVVLGPLELADHPGPLYRSHFATCPHADSHRRRA